MTAPFEAAVGRLFARLAEGRGILVAVSGGPDSMALLHLLARWREAGARPALIAATVDHGLRPEAAAEAALVAQTAGGLGLPHLTLPWTGRKPPTGVQEAARRARYRLLVAAAREAGCTHLVTGHTLDDQAETVLMRIAKGTGLTGLAGMRPEVDRDGILHVRPLLDVPKATLIDLCRRENWPFVEDPSNLDEQFTRVRMRKLLPLLAQEGLTAERLARLAERAQRAESALDFAAEAAFGEALRREEPGCLVLRGAVLAEKPFEVAVRVLARGLLRIGGGIAPSRLARLETATERLRDALGERRAIRTTLQGRLITLAATGELSIGFEPERRRGRYDSISDDAAAPPHSLGKSGEGT